MKKIFGFLLVVMIVIGSIQLVRSISYAANPINCYGGYDCQREADAGMPCGTTKDLCSCKWHFGVGTWCEKK